MQKKIKATLAVPLSHLCFYPESNDKLVTKAGLLTYFTFVAFPLVKTVAAVTKAVDEAYSIG